jgi:hypothetical protein
MRDYKINPAENTGACHQLLTGQPMTTPLTHLSLTPGGGAMEPVAPLATVSGDAQAALSAGGHGVLKRAGRP